MKMRKAEDNTNATHGDEEDMRGVTVRGTIEDACMHTGAHGVSNIYRTRSLVRRLVWCAVFFAGMGIMVWQVTVTVLTYYTYPTTTLVTNLYASNLAFPAVTICNNNPYESSKLRHYDNQIYNRLVEAARHEDFDIGGISDQWEDFLSDYDDYYDYHNDYTSGYYNSTEAPPEFGNEYIGADEYGCGEADHHGDTDVYDLGEGDEWYSNSTFSNQNVDQDQDGTTDGYYSGDFHDDHYEDYYDYFGSMWSGEQDEDFEVVEEFFTNMSRFSREDRLSLGHELGHMMFECTWQGSQCNGSHFYRFHNYQYGNCYTFNSGVSSSALNASKEGSLFGLTMSLYVDQRQYLPGVVDGAGMRLVVHDQADMPLPEEQGINLRPGTKTSVALRKTLTARLKQPYGDCEEPDDVTNSRNNAFTEEYSNIGYSVNACKKTCLQRALLERCGCHVYSVPYSASSAAFEGLSLLNVTQCRHPQPANRACFRSIMMSFLADQLGCKETCKEKCLETIFSTQLSTLDWPSLSSLGKIFRKLDSTSDFFYDVTSAALNEFYDDDTSGKIWLRNNFARLEVYFETFDYTYIQTKAAYEPFKLVADFGGQVGLWLGLSMVTVFELIELFIDLLVVTLRWCRKKRTLRKTSEANWAVRSHKHRF